MRKMENESVEPEPTQMSRQQIEESLQHVLDDIRNKRKQDLNILADVKKEIRAQAEKSCEVLEAYMLNMHTVRQRELDKKVSELVCVLENVKKSERELEESKRSLSYLCQDMHQRN